MNGKGPSKLILLIFFIMSFSSITAYAFVYQQQSQSMTQTIINVPSGVWTTPTSIYDKCGQNDPYVFPASKTIDDDTGTQWVHNIDERHWIVFDMGETKTITKVRVYQGAYKLLDVNCYVSDDPANWGTAVFTNWDLPNTNAWNESPSFSESGRYIKLDNMWTTYWFHYMYTTFYELDAYC